MVIKQLLFRHAASQMSGMDHQCPLFFFNV